MKVGCNGEETCSSRGGRKSAHSFSFLVIYGLTGRVKSEVLLSSKNAKEHSPCKGCKYPYPPVCEIQLRRKSSMLCVYMSVRTAEADVYLGYVIHFFLKYTVIKGKQRGHLFKIWMKFTKTFSPISWSSVIRNYFLFSLFWLA